MYSRIDEMDSYTEEMAIAVIMIGMIHIPLGCTTISLTLPEIFKLKGLEKSLKEMEQSLLNQN